MDEQRQYTEQEAEFIYGKPLACEWCDGPVRFRLWNTKKKYERYACNSHISKAKKLAELDGVDFDQAWSVTDVYRIPDLLFKQR